MVLGHLTSEYPNKLDHVLNGREDLKSPRALHPIFCGSFDWHSNVHGYWLLATVYRCVPDLPQRPTIREIFDTQFAETNIAGEVAYLARPFRGTFERPYAWAWLLMLAAELARHATDDGRRWAARLSRLAEAFAIALALEYAEVVGDEPLAGMLRATAIRWYENDVDCQTWEPCGDDFLSPALTEAECMRRVLTHDAWQVWFDRFLPRIGDRMPSPLFRPAVVNDRTDGKIVHLDGLNLSRAWCWRSIATSWTASDPRRAIALEAADAHLESSLPHVVGDYVGEHWLATFALLAMMVGESAAPSVAERHRRR